MNSDKSVRTTDRTDLGEYRRRARSWLQANAGREPWPDSDDNSAVVAFMNRLYDAGYIGITWPKEYGGQGLTNAEERAFAEEAAAYVLPSRFFTIGLGICGPTIRDCGNDQQRRRYLRPLLRCEEIWCQLFSEPSAGSDVASLQTSAVRDGDEWVANGQKVWTTGAHFADYAILIARTNVDVPKHAGITMFILDMKSAGVEVRPLRDMTGNVRFNEVYLDDVRVPADNVIGEVDGGWMCVIAMLTHERVAIGSGVGRSGQREQPTSFEMLRTTAKTLGIEDDPAVRDDLVELYLRQTAVDLFTTRLSQETNAGVPPGARGSIAKYLTAELMRFSADTAANILGIGSVAFDHDVTRAGSVATALAESPGLAIAGGTSEIQRNIIGERVLGLPREHSVDRSVPFRDLRLSTADGSQ